MMTDEEKRRDFHEAFRNEAVKLRRDLEPFAEMMRRHPAVVGLTMRGKGLAHSAAEWAFVLGKDEPE